MNSSTLQTKENEVAKLRGNFDAAAAAFLVNPQGCTCEELTGLRTKLRDSGAKLKVVKNTLARRAVADSSADDLAKLFKGPTAVIWAGSDPVSPAKILKDFSKEKESFVLKGGIVDGTVVGGKEIESLASMPSKNELFAQLLALINAPATKLLQTINAPASSLVRLLEAWRGEIEKKGGEK